MTRSRFAAPALAICLLAACGGAEPTSSSRSALSDDAPFRLPFGEKQLPAHLLEPVALLIGEMSPIVDMGAALPTPRFVALCGDDAMEIRGEINSADATLQFDFAELYDQRLLAASGIEVRVAGDMLVATVQGVHFGAPLATTGAHRVALDITAGSSVALTLDGRLVALQRGNFDRLDTRVLRFGGGNENLAPTCGAVDNVALYTHVKTLVDGRPVEPSNPLLVGYDFDGPARNRGRGVFTLELIGGAHLALTNQR